MGLYRIWEMRHPEYLRGRKLYQIDDIATGCQQGRFREFFGEQLPSFLPQITWIGDSPAAADLAILGLGVNGHVAFHEPNLPADFAFGCTKLADDTCHRLGSEPGAWGITYGIGAFVRCQTILMLVFGETKRQALEGMIARDPRYPASFMAEHPDFTIVTDLAI